MFDKDALVWRDTVDPDTYLFGSQSIHEQEPSAWCVCHVDGLVEVFDPKFADRIKSIPIGEPVRLMDLVGEK